MSQRRTLKVFCEGDERKAVIGQYGSVAEYDAFVLVEADEKAAKEIAKEVPLEDITALYTIHAGIDQINTKKSRVTAAGKTASHPAYKGANVVDAAPHHYLIQFIGPIKKQWLSKVKSAGGQPRRPFADFTYIVRCDKAALQEIIALPFVRWAGHLSHRNRVASSVEPELRALPRTEYLPSVHKIEFFDKNDMKAGLKPLRALDLTIVSKDEGSAIANVRLEGTHAQQAKTIKKISAIHGVAAIRNRSLNRTSNNVAARILAGAASQPPAHLDGAGETIAVCDTGLDTGEKSTIHTDFKNRVKAIKSYRINPAYDPLINNPGGDDGPADVDNGHGTHVAGSVLGSGHESENLPSEHRLIRGLAHAAALVFQAVEQECEWKRFEDEERYGRFTLAGIPDDLTRLFSYAYNKGARIHSNSWGGGDPGAYDEQCRQLDAFAWKKKDFCVLVAAGNDGTDRDGDGTINPTSVTSPATAKNCITVGASESLRPIFDAERYGEWWPRDYPKKPFKADPMANDPQQVAAFSSRGPTSDGRTKPDVVAPGTFILSTRSRKISPTNTAWAAFPPSKSYFYMGGTSMATPLVAGATALLRQFLRKQVGFSSPSAALLKATLILAARRLPKLSANGQLHDNHQGFGIVDLANTVTPGNGTNVWFVDQPFGLQTGQQEDIPVQVHSSHTPLRIVLAYTDYPGDALVNNLNLQIKAPDGSVHVGNQTQGTLRFDTKNNVEVIEIAEPATGSWTLRVIGSNVPNGPQDYAIAFSGNAK